MKFPAKRAKVFPNPWGIHPRAAFRAASDGQLRFIGSEGVGHDQCIDHAGRPCAVISSDQVAGGGRPGIFVGSKVDLEHTTAEKLIRGDDIRSPRQRTVYKYLGATAHETTPHQLALELASKEPIDLPVTNYYRDLAVNDGLLIAADEESARILGTSKFFVDPAELFLALSEMAAKACSARYEDLEDAYEHFVEERAKEIAEKAKAKAKEAADQAAEGANP